MQKARLKDTEFTGGEFVKFDREAGEIEISNTSQDPIDILPFGSEHYDEPIVAQGPFVIFNFRSTKALVLKICLKGR